MRVTFNRQIDIERSSGFNSQTCLGLFTFSQEKLSQQGKDPRWNLIPCASPNFRYSHYGRVAGFIDLLTYQIDWFPEVKEL